MLELNDLEKQGINGKGLSIGWISLIGGLGSLLVGILEGFFHPSACR